MDPSGLASLVNTDERTGACDIACIQEVSNSWRALVAEDRFTWQGGSFTVSIALFGAYVQASVTVVGQSQDGSKGILAAVGAGGTTSVFGPAFTAAPMISNARTVSDYEGVFGHMGVCAGAVALACVEDQRGQAHDGKSIEVISPGGGMGLQPSWAVVPIPAEFHGLASNTWTLLQWR